jgi:hypothetical protein
MNLSCESVRERLSGYLDRALPQPEREAVSRHLAGCRDCDAALAETRGLVGALHELDRVALPEGFSDRLAARLRAEAAARPALEAAPRAARNPWWSGWFPFAGWPARALAGVAAVALLYLAFAVGPQRGPVAPLPGGTGAPVALTSAHVGLGGDAVVRIWFDAAQDVDGVRFTLELPPGLRMVRDGRVVESPFLTWEGDLKAGRNLIPLPVRGIARGEWTVKASVEKAGSRRERKIGLRVDGA